VSGADAAKPYIIPEQRLPPGFAQGIDRVPETIALARPAATVVLVRDTDNGLEALLMRRHRAAGFVPGAWVFPGGRVDPADVASDLWPPAAPVHVPPREFWVAAVREVFEETGVLLATREDGTALDGRAVTDALGQWRSEMLADRATLLDMLRDMRLRLALEETIHLAHWVTPVVEPRRYDTHFFLAHLPAGATVTADPREMTAAQWLSPRVALHQFERGELPMVFPTVRVLEALAPFSSVQDATRALRGRVVPTIMPRLVRVKDGIAFLIDQEGSE
jgi:8-oxo-dGTP pyrophosphatase MutT (NUDIX family)